MLVLDVNFLLPQDGREGGAYWGGLGRAAAVDSGATMLDDDVVARNGGRVKVVTELLTLRDWAVGSLMVVGVGRGTRGGGPAMDLPHIGASRNGDPTVVAVAVESCADASDDLRSTGGGGRLGRLLLTSFLTTLAAMADGSAPSSKELAFIIRDSGGWGRGGAVCVLVEVNDDAE